MRILLFITLILIQSGCATVKVAKEVTKATNSIRTSVEKLINNQDDNNLEDKNKTDNPKKEMEALERERERERELAINQKKIIKNNFVGKTLNQVKSYLGDESLNRHDGNTQTVRFDINSCKLFLFFNSNNGTPKVEYFEIRDTIGNIVSSKEKIQDCYKDYDFT